MEWLKLLIPIIAVAVYIISQLAANQQNRRRPTPRALPPPDEALALKTVFHVAPESVERWTRNWSATRTV